MITVMIILMIKIIIIIIIAVVPMIIVIITVWQTYGKTTENRVVLEKKDENCVSGKACGLKG